jgi:signal transduction histidine kinase
MWMLSYAIWLAQPDSVSALFWARMLNLGATFMPVLYLHWVTLVFKVEKKHRVLLIIGYMGTILYSAFSFSPLYIDRVMRVGGFPFWPQADVLYAAFLFSMLIPFFAYGIYLLVRVVLSKDSDPSTKIQSKYMLIGTILSVVGGWANFPLMFGIAFIAPQLTMLTIFHPMFFAYGSLQHKIFNMKTIATEILVFGLWIFILVRTILFQNTTDQLIEGVLLLIVLVFGIFLILSVDKEVKSREALSVANKAQSETMNFITHQIRGVFTDTKAGLAAIIEGDLGAVADPMKNTVSHMLERQNRGVIEVETFLKADRIDNGTVKYEMKPFDFKQMVIQLADQEKARAESKKLKYEVRISDGDYVINGDQTYLGQVVSNLIDNAIRYTPAGSVEIGLARKDDRVTFSVKDSGVGVNEEDSKKLFTKYGHGKDSRRINTESNGLGLFIVKGIVDGHHGKIWYESTGAGKGTTFMVELPVA